jgi:hypothetical protein
VGSVGERDRGALVGESLRDPAADAAARSGDQRDAAVEPATVRWFRH